jgi:hypothetical protein
MNTFTSKIWLKSNKSSKSKNQIFSLVYSENGKDVYTDITGYRPDPREVLSEKKVYDGTITREYECNYKNEDVSVLKHIIIGNHKFVYVR